MKIVYFGTSSFAVPALIRVASHVQLVVSQPDRPSGRGMKLHASEVKQAALQLGLPIETPVSCRDEGFISHIRSLQADLLLVAAYGQIMPMALLESANQGGFNLHGSLLPRYRGAAPIQRSLMAGDSETGVTLMKMAKGMDTGDMIAKVKTLILPDETYGELHERLAELAAEMAAEWLPKLYEGSYPHEAQDSSLATIAPKIEKEETLLSVQQGGQQAYQMFRGLTPKPGASLFTSLGRIKLLEARLWHGNEKPGKIVQSDAGFGVAFQSDGLLLKSVQPEGKKPMTGKDWINGAHLKPGNFVI